MPASVEERGKKRWVYGGIWCLMAVDSPCREDPGIRLLDGRREADKG